MMQTNVEEPKSIKAHKEYTEEFKRSVVAHWVESGKSARIVAEEFGIKQWNLRDWRFKFGPAPKGPEDPVSDSPEGLQREIRRLRQELTRVTTQREILKKTLAIVSEA
jgi:transposase-like protein